MYPLSPKLPSHPGWCITIEQSSLHFSRSLLVIHFKYNSMYMSTPNSLTILSPRLFPWQPYVYSLSLRVCLCFENKFICILSF